MAKIFFELGAPYDSAGPHGEALRVRRLKHSGRLVLYQIMNDPPLYWFVQIRNFEPNGRDRILIEKKLIRCHSVPSWRFLHLAKAETKYEQLKAFFLAPPKRIMSAAQIAGLNRGRAKLAAYQAAKKELHSGVLDSTPSALRGWPNNADGDCEPTLVVGQQ